MVNSDWKEFYSGKNILITGAAGTVGSELTMLLRQCNFGELRLLDHNETGMFFLMEHYSAANVKCFLGDVRDRDKLNSVFKGADVVLHCAALKHVILSELNPYEAVQSNIIGTENVIKASIDCKVGNVLFTSSDKAVNPTNVMGASKLMGEKMVTAANIRNDNTCTILSSTRFGNVLGSRGSVVPIFYNQIKNKAPVTLTDTRMTRFIMTPEDSALLVLKSVTLACGGEVFVTKMPVVRIIDLAEVMIELLAPTFGHNPKDIDIIHKGAKIGEKFYEELMSLEESSRALELEDLFVLIPAFKSMYTKRDFSYEGEVITAEKRVYNSDAERPLSKDELRNYLLEKDIFNKF